MNIAVIGTRGSGQSFFIDHTAQLLSKAGRNVCVCDKSKAKSIYRKYALNKEQEMKIATKVHDNYTVIPGDAQDNELNNSYDFNFIDMEYEDLDLVKLDNIQMLCVLTNLDYHKYQDMSQRFLNGNIPGGIDTRLIINEVVHRHARHEPLTVGHEGTFKSISFLDFDGHSKGIDLHGRINGHTNVMKLSRHTKMQIHKICTDLFGLKEKLRRLK